MHAAEFSPVACQEHGIAAADIAKLRSGGIHTIEQVAHATKKELGLLKGLSDAKVEKLQAAGKYIVLCLFRLGRTSFYVY